MARISALEFAEQVHTACADSEIVMHIETLSASTVHIQLRIFLVDRSFLDVYYDQSNGKTSFAQIYYEKRIFGADNASKIWHWHPLENPEVHQLVDHEITFAEFLRQVETHLSQR